ncbi:MAG: hypothetical protein LBM05_01845, partial [Endomicrobium sp.]|nr:hypothetical protein [Endomicrobium sp.]
FNKNLPQSYRLKIAMDRKKDQTYFLYRLTGKILSKIIFPLATYTKQEVKGIYSQLKFNIEMQKESQDLCYGKTHEILKLYCSQSKKNCGNIVNIHGNILGQHNGIWNYTIGQRKLLCTNIKQKATSLPLYVIKILPSKNEIIVSDNKLDLYSSYCTVTNVVWHIPLQTNIIHCIIKLRSQHLGAKAMIIVNKLTVKFHEPQKAITPGQSAVFYNGDYVIGGGIIL